MSRAAAMELSADDRALLQDTAARIVGARMAVPAMMFLETVSPMNYVSSAMLRVMSPAWRTFVPASRIDQVAKLLERRDAIPTFIRMIDEAEDDRRREEKAEKAAQKAARAAEKSRSET